MRLLTTLLMSFLAAGFAAAGTWPEYCEDHSTDSSKSPQNRSTFLWSIRNSKLGLNSTESYLFGTIHVPYTEVWDYVDPTVKSAFQRADNIFFELDLSNPQTLYSLSKCQLLPTDVQLIDYLPQALYKRLELYLEFVKSHLPSWLSGEEAYRKAQADYLFHSIAGDWTRKRPVWMMLLMNSLTKREIRSRGVPVLDLYLAQQAQLLAKATGAIERVSEQCDPLNSLNLTQVIFALNQTLSRHEAALKIGKEQIADGADQVGNAARGTADLVEHYNCGQLDETIFNRDTVQFPEVRQPGAAKVDVESIEKAAEIDEYFRQTLIVRRNYRMANRVGHLLATQPHKSFFFAFGAGHFIGKNDNVLNLLRQAGYSVEPVPSTAAEPGARDPKKSSNFNEETSMKRLVGEFFFSDRRSGKNSFRQKFRRNRQRQFNDLWIRSDRLSTKPWNEIEVDVRTTPIPPPAVRYEKYFYFVESGSQRLFGSFLQLFISFVAFILTVI